MLSLSESSVRVALSVAAVGLLLVTPWVVLAVDKPNLVVTSVTSPPTDVLPGDTFEVVTVVTNNGTAPTQVPPQSDNVTKFILKPTGSGSKKNLKGLQIIKTPLAVGESDGANVPVTLVVFSDTPAGTYQLQACADGLDFIDEVLDTDADNCRIASGTITVGQAPDLVVNAGSVTHTAPSPVGLGQSFEVKNTVKNVGAVLAPASVTKYYLVSASIIKDLKGPLDPTTGVPALDKGDSFPETEMVTVRPETIPGTYVVRACADGGKFLAEQDNNNNCADSSSNVVVVAMPDLVVDSVTVQPPLEVFPGNPLVISAVVTNIGSVPPLKSSTLKLVLVNTVTKAETNLKLKNPLTVPPLAAGFSTTVDSTNNVTVYSDTESGTYTVKVCADKAKVIPEAVESNNCTESAAIVTVLGGSAATNADLAVTEVTDLQCSPETCLNAIPGTNISVKATIKNLGTDPVDASPANPFTIGFNLVQGAIKKNLKVAKDNDSVKITQPIAPAGSPGDTVIQMMTVQVYSDTVVGTYGIQGCADTLKAFKESDENNNCSEPTGTITVIQVPNLIVNSLGNPPPKAALGDSFPLTIQVKNTGLVATTQLTRTKYSLIFPDTSPTTRQELKGPSTPTVPALGANKVVSDTETLTIRTNTVPGEYFVEACVDSDKDVTEGNEDDNCKVSTAKINVTGLPDYVVTSVSVKNAPVQVKRGATLTVSATVKNQGIGDASKESILKFFLVSTTPNGPTKNLDGTKTIAKLAVGKSASVSGATVTVFGDTPFGTYNVQACADATDVLVESATGPGGTSETNNCKQTTDTVEVIVQ